MSLPVCGEVQALVRIHPDCEWFHDLWHHAITKLTESQASDTTVMAIAGHVSPKVLAHYSHVRLQAKRTALDALVMKRPDMAKSGDETSGNDTNNDTKREYRRSRFRRGLKNLVSAAGVEPATHALKGIPKRKINKLRGE